MPIFAALLLLSETVRAGLGSLRTPIEIIAFSGLVGGVPYLFLAGLLLWLMRGKTESKIKRILFLSPFLFLPVFVGHFLLFGLMVSGPEGFRLESAFQTLLEITTDFAPYVLGFGFSYVALVFGAVFLLKKTGLVYE